MTEKTTAIEFVGTMIAHAYQHILKKDVTLDAEPYATIPAGTPLFGEEQGHFIVFRFGEHKRQIPKTHF